MDFLIILFLIIEVFFLLAADRFLFGTYITPVTVLSVPYLIIVLLIIIFGKDLGFVSIYYPSILVWIIGLPVFWIPGAILATFLLRKTNLYSSPYSIHPNPAIDKLTLSFAWLCIFILSATFIIAIRNSQIGTLKFEQYFGSGIVGHILLVSKLFFIYMLVRFKKSSILPVVFLLFFYFVYGVKGWIFIPILAAVIIRLLIHKTQVSFALVAKILTLSLIVFYIIYRITLGPSMPFSFVIMQFFRYLFAGVLGFSEYVHHSGNIQIDPKVIISPMINIFNKLIGLKLIGLHNISTYIGAEMNSNVKSFFGTIYVFAGAQWGLTFVLITGFVSYLFLIISIKTKNLILMVVYGTSLTILFFGWFDTYSGSLFFYEFPFFGLIIFFISRNLKRISTQKTSKQKLVEKGRY